jgi:serine/threonine-protein kinase
MSLLKEIKERRLLPLMGTYLVTGFVALEGVDQLIGNGILPPLAYKIALVLYLFGVPGSLSIAWFHGAKGRQKSTRAEYVIQGILVILALATVALVVRNHQEETRLEELAATTGIEPTSIAVLYFDDLSGGDLEPVADGLTESLISQLAGVRSLDLVSRNAVAQYRGLDVSPDSIARALEVGSLIRGSVESDGDELVITARLVDGLSGADIERRVLRVPQGQFLAARDSLAENVARILRRRLGEEIRLRESREATDSDQAWSLVQRAQGLMDQAESDQDEGEHEQSLADLDRADSLLAMAESVDPAWVRPAAMRARASYRSGYFIVTSTGDVESAAEELQEGLEYAEHALTLEPSDAYALEQRGSLRYLLYLLDQTTDSEAADALLDSAQADLEAAVEADPTRATAYSVLSHLYYNRSDNVSVVLMARRAYEEDAYLRDADRILERLFWAHYDLEQFRDARTWCEEGARRFPDNHAFVECRLWLLVSSSEPADVDLAWTLQQQMTELGSEYEEKLGYLLVGGVLMKAGLADSASATFARGKGNEEIDPWQELLMYEAAIRATTGDLDGAMAPLRQFLAANPQQSFDLDAGLHWWWRGLSEREDFRALTNQ